MLSLCATRDEIPQICNIAAGKNRQPTQDEVNFLRKHLPILKLGLRDTQARMQATRDRLEMAWLNLTQLQTGVPRAVFQTWLDRATAPAPATTSPLSSAGSPRVFRRRPRPHHRESSISSPDSQLHATYVQFLGFISTIYVHQLTLHRYQTNQALLQEELSIVESLLDPLHGVPSEILEEIFLWVVEGSEMERRRRSVERGEHPNAKAWPAPFALAAVCRHWKLLVCSNPRLWQYLVLDVRDKGYNSTIHERIHQHLKYSHKLPLDITIIAWGDRLQESIVPMVLQPLQAGTLARRGLRRLELVTGGRNDIEAGYSKILAGLPPAQHLALVRVWQAHTDIRVPASFCTRLTRIDAYDAVFRLEDPCASATEATLFKTDRVRIRTLLAQTPSLTRLTIVGLTHADTGSYSPLPVETLPALRTIALRITDLATYPACLKLAPAVQLPALRTLVLLTMPDTPPSDDWRAFVEASGARVDAVEVRAVVPHAVQRGHAPAYLAHLALLPALASLRLVGDCAHHILGAMAVQPISRGMQKPPALHGVTHISISDCTLPRRALQMSGWSSWNPSARWVWRRGNAKDIEVTLERVRVEEMHAHERSFTN